MCGEVTEWPLGQSALEWSVEWEDGLEVTVRSGWADSNGARAENALEWNPDGMERERTGQDMAWSLSNQWRAAVSASLP